MNTIKFNADARPVKTIELPSFKGSQVEIYTSLKVKEQRAISKKFPNATDSKHDDAQDASYEMIIKSIKKWNFTGNDDKPLEITADILGEFPLLDITFVLEEITGKKLLNKETSIEKNG